MATLLTLQFAVYALGWAMAAVLMREARLPATLWALYGLLQALGLQALHEQPTAGGGMARVAMMLMVLAYVLAVIGIDAFIHGRPRLLGLWLAVLAGAEAFLLASLSARLPPAAVSQVYTLTVAALLITPLVAFRRRLWAEFGHWGWLATIPGGLMALIALTRVVRLWVDPQLLANEPAPASDPVRIATALVFGGVFNIGFVALIVGRLVSRLRDTAETDALSGLVSRSGLEQRLRLAWHAALRFDQPLSVAFVDINDFKRINDTAGHEAGDDAIRRVARALQRSARSIDAVGRWGGDEFVLVLPQTDADGAARAAQRLREAVSQEAIAGPWGSAPLSISVGTATRRHEDTDFASLIQRADAQMYRSKSVASSALAAAV